MSRAGTTAAARPPVAVACPRCGWRGDSGETCQSYGGDTYLGIKICPACRRAPVMRADCEALAARIGKGPS